MISLIIHPLPQSGITPNRLQASFLICDTKWSVMMPQKPPSLFETGIKGWKHCSEWVLLMELRWGRGLGLPGIGVGAACVTWFLKAKVGRLIPAVPVKFWFWLRMNLPVLKHSHRFAASQSHHLERKSMPGFFRHWPISWNVCVCIYGVIPHLKKNLKNSLSNFCALIGTLWIPSHLPQEETYSCNFRWNGLQRDCTKQLHFLDEA